MQETAGQKLRQARELKKWSIDDVARATRMHPDRVHDLEGDEYGNFPNLSYGRNFLMLYARHLGLDAADMGDPNVSRNSFGLDDYEYLHTGREQPMPAVVTEKPRRAIVPILLGLAALAVVLALVIGFVVISAKRLESRRTDVAPEPEPVSAEASPPPVVALRSGDPAPPSEAPAAQPEATAAEEFTPAAEEDVTVMRAVPVNAANTPPPAKNTVVLSAIEKAKVTVRRGTGKDAPVIFDGFLYPDAAPVTLSGDSLTIESGSADLKVERNGEPMPYTAPSLTIE